MYFNPIKGIINDPFRKVKSPHWFSGIILTGGDKN
jgi:hypothetical protein